MAKQHPVRTRTTSNQLGATGQADKDAAPAAVEARLEQLQAQLDLLKAQVRQAQQLASLGTGAAMIAHEVNNLLTPVRSYVGAALGTDDHQLHRKALAVTLTSVEMLVPMSERILEISAAKPPVRQAVVVRTAAEDAVASLCRDLSKDGIRLSMDVDESLTVWADSLQLRQVFFNLFLNARNAMAASHNGRLVVTARCDKDRVIIEVKDTGPGISPDLLPHVFDPLQTSKPSEANGKLRCAGLGLALCRDLVEENSGTISVSGEDGRGTTFTIDMPAVGP